jgi:hypothetical protein
MGEFGSMPGFPVAHRPRMPIQFNEQMTRSKIKYVHYPILSFIAKPGNPL